MVYVKILLLIIVICSYFVTYNKGKIDAINKINIDLNNKQIKQNIDIINKNKQLEKELEEERKKQAKTIVKIKKDIQYIYKENECKIEEKSIQEINDLLKKED